MKNFKRLIALLAVMVFSVTVFGCSSNTVAVVNGEKITQKQLKSQLDKRAVALEAQGVSFKDDKGKKMLAALQEQVLQEMIQEKTLLQAAEKEKVIPTKAEVEKSFADFKKNAGGEEKFKKELTKYKYTEQEVKEKIKSDLALNKLYEKVTAKVKVTEQDAEKYYNENKSTFVQPSQIKARAILVSFGETGISPMTGKPMVGKKESEAQAIAKEIINSLNQGKEFSKISDELNDDQNLKANGGLIKGQQGETLYVKGGGMPAEFDQAAFALKKGEYTKEPIKTASGFYVTKLEDLIPEKQLSLSEAKPVILNQLPNLRKQEVFNEYYTNLAKKAKIENKLPKETAKPSNQQNLESIPGGQSQKLPEGHPQIK